MTNFVKFKSLCFVVFIFMSCQALVEGHLKILSSEATLTEADLGSRLVLYCNISGLHSDILWLRDGQALTSNLSWKQYEKEGSLVSQALLTTDAGNYTCRNKKPFGYKQLSTQLLVKTPPLKLVNFTVHPSTVVATVRWHVSSNGGYPITHFTLLYRPSSSNITESWHEPQPVHISPSIRQFFVYQLKPSTDYEFRMWANNKLGAGDPSTVFASTASPNSLPVVLQHMMAGADEVTSEAWIVAICMILTTIIVLSCLSCILIYKEGKGEVPGEEDSVARIITNPGFDVNLEECYLLDHAERDYNDNTETAVRINNNSVVQPSRV